MRNSLCLLAGWLATVGPAWVHVAAVEVKLAVEDTAFSRAQGRAAKLRAGDAVTTGVPFARGVVNDVAKLSARVGEEHVPAQFIPISRWPDGSVRWALMDCQVDVPTGGRMELVVADDGRNAAPASPVKVNRRPDEVRVSTGPLEFAVDLAKFTLFKSLKVDGKELIAAGRGPVIYDVGGGEVAAAPPDVVKVEQAGPMRAVVCVKGKYAGAHRGLLGYTVRITAYAGRKFVKLHVYLENQGAYGYSPPEVKPEWFGFDGMAVELDLGLGSPVKVGCEGAAAAGALSVAQRCPGYTWKTFEYRITSGEKVLRTGARTDGVVALSGSNGRLTAAIRHFWQNYEKTIEVDGDKLRLWLWPTDGEWPRRDVRGGWKDPKFWPQFRKPGQYFLPGSTHKGHEIILDFSGRDPAATSATLSCPLMARATPAYYATTEAAPGRFAPADFATGRKNYDAHVKRWNQRALNGVTRKPRKGLYWARQGGADPRGYWYGWMDFGDNYWACGPSSLHYDWTWMMLLNYLRTGDRGFFDIGTTMARHRGEVDQLWSDRDLTPYNALSRYEKGYTGIHFGTGGHGTGRPTTTHNWISGLILYYMLTGETQMLEAVLRDYQGLLRRAVDPKRGKPGTGVQPRSSGWSVLALCSLYDLTGEKKYLDDAMVLFDNHFVPLWREKGCYWGGGLQYYYCTQGLCELHQRTGDRRILKLLSEGCENIDKFTSRYAEWRIFLSNVFAYVGHVTDNEAYVRKAEELFNHHIGDDPDPPCYIHGGGAWTKESGKILRNGHILHHVNWRRAGGK